MPCALDASCGIYGDPSGQLGVSLLAPKKATAFPRKMPIPTHRPRPVLGYPCFGGPRVLRSAPNQPKLDPATRLMLCRRAVGDESVACIERPSTLVAV